MSNKRIEMLKEFIGKDFTKSPSPFANWLKGKLIDVKEKSLIFEFIVRKEMTNPAGILHGGVVAGMIDEVMGVTFFILELDTFYPTISLNIDYFGSSKEGDKVRVITEVIKEGKTIINIRGDLLNENGKLLAQASSNLAISNMKM